MLSTHENHYTPKSTDVNNGPIATDQELVTTWILDLACNLYMVKDDMKAFYEKFGLVITDDIVDTHIKMTGSYQNYNKCFGINIHNFTTQDESFYASYEPLTVTGGYWAKHVIGVIGLNNYKIAGTYYHVLEQSRDITPTVTGPYTAVQVGSLYNFPSSLNGTGVKVGIIELGGGYILSDITHYLQTLGITGSISITDVSIDGGTNTPNDPSGASIEVVLDVEVIIALVPKASVFVYFAPNTIQGFYDAINAAIQNCHIISISWGAPEQSWGSYYMNLYSNLLLNAVNAGKSVFVASGDNGSSDGLSGNNVDFPASSPNVFGCGGTTLNNGTEVVWNGSGGGLSVNFPTPLYQSAVSNLNGRRGVPDVSGNADPNTGYILYMTGYSNLVVGGTSAVAPLWSALTAMAYQSNGMTIPGIQQTCYSHINSFKDITQGSNGSFSATVGWDKCTGLGSPMGTTFVGIFAPAPVNNNPVAAFSSDKTSGTIPLTIQYTDQSTKTPTSWSWNMGDSTPLLTSQNPQHTYTVAGTYTVSLTATNGSGSNTVTKTNYISATSVPATPVANFTASPLTGGPRRLNVQFTDQSTGTITGWTWNFSDFRPTHVQNPMHTFLNSGTFTVSLTVRNQFGSNTMTKVGYIHVT